MSSGPRQVVVVGRAKEAEAVGQHLQHAFREDEAALLGLCLQDLKDQLLLAHPGRAGDRHVLGDLRELLDAQVLQIGDVEAFARSVEAARARCSSGSGRLGWRVRCARASDAARPIVGPRRGGALWDDLA